MSPFRPFAALLAGLLVSSQALAGGTVAVVAPWARPTPPGATVAAGYVTLRNDGDAARKVVGVETPVAAMAGIHSMTQENGVMKMREVTALEVPAHGAVSLTPGGFHLMLMGLKQPLTAGQYVPLVFVLDDGSRLATGFAVRDAAP